LGRTDNDSSGIVVFLAYEGFELIANASERTMNPRWTHPIGYYGSILAAIVVYVLAIIVAIGHMLFEAMKEAQSFALLRPRNDSWIVWLRAYGARGRSGGGLCNQRRFFWGGEVARHARRARRNAASFCGRH
jgi:amino acid transporter